MPKELEEKEICKTLNELDASESGYIFMWFKEIFDQKGSLSELRTCILYERLDVRDLLAFRQHLDFVIDEKYKTIKVKDEEA